MFTQHRPIKLITIHQVVLIFSVFLKKEPELIISNDNCNSLPDFVNNVPAFKPYLNDGTLCYDAQFQLGSHLSVHNLYAYFGRSTVFSKHCSQQATFRL